jgi:hypothetical protein
MELCQQASNRVQDSEALRPHQECILADWNEGDDHLMWVIEAGEQEIVDWAEACQR